MHLNTVLNSALSGLASHWEMWLSLFLGAIVTVIIAYVIYRIQKKETSLHKQEHDSKLQRIEQLHLQDSEKIRVLYELIIQSQKGSLGDMEEAVLEQRIEAAADAITEQDSNHAQALKAIADKEKDRADDLLDKIAKQEHDLIEVYYLRQMNEYRNGNYNEAIKWCRKILDLEPDNFDALADLIQNLNKTAQHKEARELALAKLEELDKQTPPDNEKRFSLLYRIISSFDPGAEPDLAEQYVRRTRELVLHAFGEQSYQMAIVYTVQGLVRHEKQQFKESEECYRKALAIPDLSTDKAKSNRNSTLVNLGILYNSLGRYKEGLKLFHEAYTQMLSVLGDGHPSLIHPLSGLGTINCYLGNYPEADKYFQKAVDIGTARLGRNHNSTQHALMNLASLYAYQDKLAESEQIVKEVLAVQTSKENPDNIYTARLLSHLGNSLGRQKKYEEQEEVVRRALKIWEENPGVQEGLKRSTLITLASIHERKGEFKETEDIFLKVLNDMRNDGQSSTLHGAVAIKSLAEFYLRQERWAEAEQLFQESIAFFEEKAPDSDSFPPTLAGYANVLEHLGRKSEAEELNTRAQVLKQKKEQK